MKRRLGLGLVLLTTMALLIGVVGVASVSASKKKGSEGCTPGYWKVSQHYDSWTGYTPDELFADAGFEDAFPGKTLNDVLWLGGGGLSALGRHTVAALLNVASGDVDYAYTSTQTVIDAFNGVFPGGDYEGLKNIFAGFNELGCPIS
ncbi:MAG: hypothetical protein ACXWXA_10905 [Candidatus Limnocylindrales bacterium]